MRRGHSFLGFTLFLSAALVHVGAAQTRDTLALTDALLAQVVGFGGCTRLEATRPFSEPHYPGVRLIEGECILEHGDTARPLVAVDSLGLIYVLDTPSALTFLLRRHPAKGVDSTNALAYTRRAARYMGSLSEWAIVVGSRAEIPDSVWRITQVKQGQVLPTGIRQWLRPWLAEITVLAYGPEAILYRKYFLDVRDGQLTEMVKSDYWRPPE